MVWSHTNIRYGVNYPSRPHTFRRLWLPDEYVCTASCTTNSTAHCQTLSKDCHILMISFALDCCLERSLDHSLQHHLQHSSECAIDCSQERSLEQFIDCFPDCFLDHSLDLFLRLFPIPISRLFPKPFSWMFHRWFLTAFLREYSLLERTLEQSIDCSWDWIIRRGFF